MPTPTTPLLLKARFTNIDQDEVEHTSLARFYLFSINISTLWAIPINTWKLYRCSRPQIAGNQQQCATNTSSTWCPKGEARHSTRSS
jgi:hypothetical protein